MKKTITVMCLIAGLLIILDSVNASHCLVLFFLVGVIPGTNILISATDALAANATAMTIVILRITAWPTIRTVFFPHVTIIATIKKHTPHQVI